MAGRVAGKVAFVTGAARGQGRSHAVRLAEEGADIVAIDVMKDIDGLAYSMGSQSEMDETVRQVQALGRRIVAGAADVRDAEQLSAALSRAVADLGRLDIVVANAAICTHQPWDEVTPQIWNDTLAVNLTGVWNTMVAAAPHLIASGGGSMICIGSTASLKGLPHFAPYVAAKHGVIGIARTMANELARDRIRVNTIHPTGVATPMAESLSDIHQLLETRPDIAPIYANTYPVETLDPVDVSNAVLFLASDESRYVTGLAMTVDAGCTIR
jgi:SDR family mycofactocin-dependent oxidoreductase